MAQANPPPHLQIPLAFKNNPEVLRFFEKQQFIIYQLWSKIGGPEDSIEEAFARIDNNELNIENNSGDIWNLIGLTAIDRNARAASASTTTAGDEIIICTDAITVTLNAEPDDQEMVTVKITNGDVTIDANGKTLDGQTDITFIATNFQGQPSIDCKYLTELDAWYIV